MVAVLFWTAAAVHAWGVCVVASRTALENDRQKQQVPQDYNSRWLLRKIQARNVF